MIATLASSLSSGAGFLAAKVDPGKLLQDKNAVDLARAASRGDVRGMERALARGADVNARGDQGFTPLFYALYKRNIKGFSWLLEHGANPNVGIGPENYSIISLSARQENIAYLRLALDNGGDPNWRDADVSYRYPIFHAIGERFNEHAKLLVKSGADVNVFGTSNDTPIRSCISRSNFALARFILDHGGDPLRKYDRSFDALHLMETFQGFLPTRSHEVKRDYIAFVEELRLRGYTVNVGYGRSREELLRAQAAASSGG